MVYIKAEIKGEPDVPVFTRVIEYADKSDELIFYNSVETIKEKLSRKLRINTNETLTIYFAYVIDQLRSQRSIKYIKKNASKILSTQDVMIGVPETLRRIKFEAIVDNLPEKKIVLDEPIPTSNYILAPLSKTKTNT
jgi:urease gamma subunit